MLSYCSPQLHPSLLSPIRKNYSLSLYQYIRVQIFDHKHLSLLQQRKGFPEFSPALTVLVTTGNPHLHVVVTTQEFVANVFFAMALVLTSLWSSPPYLPKEEILSVLLPNAVLCNISQISEHIGHATFSGFMPREAWGVDIDNFSSLAPQFLGQASPNNRTKNIMIK